MILNSLGFRFFFFLHPVVGLSGCGASQMSSRILKNSSSISMQGQPRPAGLGMLV